MLKNSRSSRFGLNLRLLKEGNYLYFLIESKNLMFQAYKMKMVDQIKAPKSDMNQILFYNSPYDIISQKLKHLKSERNSNYQFLNELNELFNDPKDKF